MNKNRNSLTNTLAIIFNAVVGIGILYSLFSTPRKGGEGEFVGWLALLALAFGCFYMVHRRLDGKK